VAVVVFMNVDLFRRLFESGGYHRGWLFGKKKDNLPNSLFSIFGSINYYPAFGEFTPGLL